MPTYITLFLIVSIGIYIMFVFFKNTPTHIILMDTFVLVVIIAVLALIFNRIENESFIKNNNCTIQSVESGVIFNTSTYICNDGKTHIK
ncbi:hypothetical protein DYG63_20600 [Yersinia enterocolitica]|nr:hypothetical protein [Yersinia enterocolitica]